MVWSLFAFTPPQIKEGDPVPQKALISPLRIIGLLLFLTIGYQVESVYIEDILVSMVIENTTMYNGNVDETMTIYENAINQGTLERNDGAVSVSFGVDDGMCMHGFFIFFFLNSGFLFVERLLPNICDQSFNHE